MAKFDLEHLGGYESCNIAEDLCIGSVNPRLSSKKKNLLERGSIISEKVHRN